MSKKKKKNIKPNPTQHGQGVKTDTGTDAKKAAVLNNDKKSNLTYIITVAAIVLVSGIAYYMSQGSNEQNYNSSKVVYQTTPSSNQQIKKVNAAAKSSGNDIVYNISQFQDGKAKYFQYKYGGTTIKYFILKSSDGIIRAAFDACDVCWREGKGYQQQGDDMVCRNCGRRFPSVKVNVIKGGCNPAPLRRRVEGGKLVINVKDIIEGSQYFNFKRS